MATEDPLRHLSAEQRRRGSLRLLHALFPERFVTPSADSSLNCPDGDEAAEYSFTGSPDGRS